VSELAHWLQFDLDRVALSIVVGSHRSVSPNTVIGCSANTAHQKGRGRFERDGLDGLADPLRPGKPLVHDQAARARLIAKGCTRPRLTFSRQRRSRWTDGELVAEVEMSRSHAHAILREADIRPHLTEYWVMSELSPAFDAQAAEVCGLCLNPPENTIVVSIDEETGIQAKGLVCEDTPPAPGKPGRRDNEYVRNGTQNLFAGWRSTAAASRRCRPRPATARISSPSWSWSTRASPPMAG
jgi:hypothetical protein